MNELEELLKDFEKRIEDRENGLRKIKEKRDFYKKLKPIKDEDLFAFPEKYLEKVILWEQPKEPDKFGNAKSYTCYNNDGSTNKVEKLYFNMTKGFYISDRQAYSCWMILYAKGIIKEEEKNNPFRINYGDIKVSHGFELYK